MENSLRKIIEFKITSSLFRQRKDYYTFQNILFFHFLTFVTTFKGKLFTSNNIITRLMLQNNFSNFFLVLTLEVFQ